MSNKITNLQNQIDNKLIQSFIEEGESPQIQKKIQNIFSLNHIQSPEGGQLEAASLLRGESASKKYKFPEKYQSTIDQLFNKSPLGSQASLLDLMGLEVFQCLDKLKKSEEVKNNFCAYVYSMYSYSNRNQFSQPLEEGLKKKYYGGEEKWKKQFNQIKEDINFLCSKENQPAQFSAGYRKECSLRDKQIAEFPLKVLDLLLYCVESETHLSSLLCGLGEIFLNYSPSNTNIIDTLKIYAKYIKCLFVSAREKGILGLCGLNMDFIDLEHIPKRPQEKNKLFKKWAQLMDDKSVQLYALEIELKSFLFRARDNQLTYQEWLEYIKLRPAAQSPNAQELVEKVFINFSAMNLYTAFVNDFRVLLENQFIVKEDPDWITKTALRDRFLFNMCALNELRNNPPPLNPIKKIFDKPFLPILDQLNQLVSDLMGRDQNFHEATFEDQVVETIKRDGKMLFSGEKDGLEAIDFFQQLTVERDLMNIFHMALSEGRLVDTIKPEEKMLFREEKKKIPEAVGSSQTVTVEKMKPIVTKTVEPVRLAESMQKTENLYQKPVAYLSIHSIALPPVGQFIALENQFYQLVQKLPEIQETLFQELKEIIRPAESGKTSPERESFLKLLKEWRELQRTPLEEKKVGIEPHFDTLENPAYIQEVRDCLNQCCFNVTLKYLRMLYLISDIKALNWDFSGLDFIPEELANYIELDGFLEAIMRKEPSEINSFEKTEGALVGGALEEFIGRPIENETISPLEGSLVKILKGVDCLQISGGSLEDERIHRSPEAPRVEKSVERSGKKQKVKATPSGVSRIEETSSSPSNALAMKSKSHSALEKAKELGVLELFSQSKNGLESYGKTLLESNNVRKIRTMLEKIGLKSFGYRGSHRKWKDPSGEGPAITLCENIKELDRGTLSSVESQVKEVLEYQEKKKMKENHDEIPKDSAMKIKEKEKKNKRK